MAEIIQIFFYAFAVVLWLFMILGLIVTAVVFIGDKYGNPHMHDDEQFHDPKAGKS